MQNHSTDGDWISRRWQGEGEVKLVCPPVPIDHDKLARIAGMRDAKDLDGNCGAHCQHDTCKAFDYLPTTCTSCGKKFCGAHAAPEAHGCDRRAILGDKKAPTCLLCHKPIHVEAGENVERAMDRHIESGCKSGLAEQVRKQRNAMNRCQHGKGKKACKECPLVRFECKDCGRSFCLKHRHPADHKCTGVDAKRSNPSALFGRAPQVIKASA